jgi:hypothetical protein
MQVVAISSPHWLKCTNRTGAKPPGFSLPGNIPSDKKCLMMRGKVIFERFGAQNDWALRSK